LAQRARKSLSPNQGGLGRRQLFCTDHRRAWTSDVETISNPCPVLSGWSDNQALGFACVEIFSMLTPERRPAVRTLRDGRSQYCERSVPFESARPTAKLHLSAGLHHPAHRGRNRGGEGDLAVEIRQQLVSAVGVAGVRAPHGFRLFGLYVNLQRRVFQKIGKRLRDCDGLHAEEVCCGVDQSSTPDPAIVTSVLRSNSNEFQYRSPDRVRAAETSLRVQGTWRNRSPGLRPAFRRRPQEGGCSATFRRSHLVALLESDSRNGEPYAVSKSPFSDEPDFHKVSE